MQQIIILLLISITCQAKGPFYDPTVQDLFKRDCITCHGGNTSLPNWLIYNIAFSNRDKIRTRAIDKKDMPLGGKLSDEDYNILKMWLDNGALEKDK
jgi:mono/diheme cytochrome c family protein